MKLDHWFRPPRHLLLMFLLVSLGPAAALGWLSWRLLEQDRALEAQRIQELIENAADMASAYLRQGQTEVEEKLARLTTLPQADLTAAASLEAESLGDAVLLVAFQREEVRAFPRERLLYFPYLPPVQEASATVFSAGENYEYRQQDYSRAIAVFRKLGASTDTATRAGALMRLARTLRKAERFDEAMAAYAELERMESLRIGSVGVPSELLARHSRCSVLEQLKRRSDLRNEAEALSRDLARARWPLLRAAYDYYRGETMRWLGPEAADRSAPPAEKPALAAAVENLWDDWQRIQLGKESGKGRRSLWLYDQPVLLAWDSTPQQLVALVAGCSYFEGQIRTLMATGLRGRALQPTLADTEGHVFFGHIPPPGTPHARRTAAELRLPWTLYMTSSNPAADIADLASRRRLLLGGLAMIAVLLIAGVYFIGRSVTRELELARLKSDFVSAVSHEFRSPLTSMRQLTGMLATGRVPNPERQSSYFDVLSRETIRLQRLVEGLLNFGRMEAGAMEYSFETIDVSAVVRRVVTDFQQEVQEDGYQIDLVAGGPGPLIRADPEAFSRALWNLLDNAVKYSPDCRTVRVELARDKHELFVRVQDRGVGIPPGEQRDIFRKFVRGAAAASTLAKGTGIGLAMADHIVRAHGGRIRVESEPGRGSTFTLILPVEE
jgi:signal transduction histidine kinase